MIRTGHVHEFEEIPLCVGKSKDGKRQNIALLTGSCEIERDYASKEWEIVKVTLTGPLLHDLDTEITFGHPLWNVVTESLEHSRGEEIFQSVLDACEPDPDHARELQRELV